jgi:hypothetical protein
LDDWHALSDMSTEKVIVLLYDLALIALWIAANKLNWFRRIYEKKRASAYTWFWLDTFHVAKTPQNCIRFMQVSFAAVIVLVMLGTLLLLFTH